MATRSISRSIPRLLTRSFASSASLSKTPSASSFLSRSRPLAAALSSVLRGGLVSVKGLSSQATSSSLNDPSPNWSNRPPKETILLDGCDFEHWLVVVDAPQGDLTRDEIIDGYIKTLAQIVGSEEEARMKIYSVSHRCYFAFGALVSEDLSHKLKELPNVRWVLPDSYLDVRNKGYGGEPFIDGRAVPYDPKYHEEWIRNNARANEKNRRNDRPRNNDKSRNFEKRRDNMAGGSPPQRPPMRGPPPPHMGGSAPPPPHMGQNYGGLPSPNNMGGQRPPPNYGGAPPQNNMGGQRPPPNHGGTPPPNHGGAPSPNYGGAPPPNYGGPPPPNYGGAPQTSIGGAPPQTSIRGVSAPNHGVAPSPNHGGAPPPNYGGAPPPNYGGPPPPPNYGGAPQTSIGGVSPPNYGGVPPPNYGGAPPPNYGGAPPPNYGGAPPQTSIGGGPPNAGWSGNNNSYQQQSGGMQQPQYHNNYPPNRDGSSGNPYQG